MLMSLRRKLSNLLENSMIDLKLWPDIFLPFNSVHRIVGYNIVFASADSIYGFLLVIFPQIKFCGLYFNKKV